MRRRALLLALALAPLPVASPVGAGPEENLDLIRAKAQQARATSQATQLENEAEAALARAAKARAEAAALAARVQQGEARIAAAKAHVIRIDALRARQRAALARHQAPAAQIAAALETMARRPALLLFTRPGSLSDMVHSRMLLANTLPQIETRSAAIRAEVTRGDRLRAAAGQALAALRAHQAALDRDRTALARAEAAQRALARRKQHAAMLQHERAQGMAEKADDLVALMARLDADAARSTRLAALPGPVPRPGSGGRPAAPPPTQPGTPDWTLPLIGRVITGTGEIAASGVRAKGLTIAPAPGALAVAPAAGVVRFAGAFRSYGEIVVIDHGGGWASLVAGLGTSRVAVGAEVAKGSPIGTAPAEKPRVTVELRHGARPVDIARLAVRP